MNTGSDAKKLLKTFFIIFIIFTIVIDYFVARAGSVRASGMLLAFFGMWSPGFSAILTLLIHKKSLRELWWKWGKTKYQLWSIAVPFLYVFVGYLFVWITGLGKFNGTNLSSTLLNSLIWIVPAMFMVLGEEIGWAGFFVPQLSRITTYTKTSFIRGLVWGLWHFPIIFLADYSTPGLHKGYAAACFLIFFIGISFGFTWLNLKSRSLWSSMFFHGFHNLLIQGIFKSLTMDTGPTKYFIDEFSITFAVIGIIVGLIFWSKRSELDDSKCTLARQRN